MHTQTLASQTQSVIDIIKTLPDIKNFYLSGGTALALYLGHRESEDLDFFCENDFDPYKFQQSLLLLGKLEDTILDKGTLNTYLNEVKLQFLHYPYDLLESLTEWNGIYLSSIIDIACTKLITVSMRGSKKDFIDLYVILQKIPINELLTMLEKEYKNVDYNTPAIIKSLTYFEDADQQPMPKMHILLDWEAVKDFFIQETRKIIF